MIAANACKHRIAVGTIHPLIKNTGLFILCFSLLLEGGIFGNYDVIHYPNCEHAPAERFVFSFLF